MILYDITKKDVMPKRYETHIIGQSGDVTRTLSRGESKRVYVKYERIPMNLIKAIIAVEDKRFYRHRGIDPKGIIRAMVKTVQSGGKNTQGGSTITQQLIKNTLFTDWTKERIFFDKIRRKINELFLAPKLEKRTGKKQIIECYLNTIYMGEGCYGIQTASVTYFGKDVWELNLGECAMLAGIPKNPARFDPFFSIQRSIERRNWVLGTMHKQKFITADEYETEKSKNPAEFIRHRREVHKNHIRPYSWFEDALISELISELEEKGLSLKQAWEKLFEGGLRIYSTENADIQRYAESLCCDPDIIPEPEKENGPQVAVIMLDMESGAVRVSVGGRGEKTTSRLFDRAGKAKRIHGVQTMVRAFSRLDYTPGSGGTNILEMCAAYADHENGGVLPAVHYYDSVLENDGRILMEPGIEKKSKNREPRHFKNPLPKMWEITIDTDVWVIGKVGKNVLGVWGGYDDNRHLPLKKEYYTYPKCIWKKIAEHMEKGSAE